MCVCGIKQINNYIDVFKDPDIGLEKKKKHM